MKIFFNTAHDRERLNKLLFFLSELLPARRQELTDTAADLSTGMTMEIKPQSSRSRPQENYYRKWVREFGKHCGLTPSEMHDEILCIHFGIEETETPFGVKRRPAKRSKNSTRDEYTELVNTLIRVASEMNFSIPEPRHDDG